MDEQEKQESEFSLEDILKEFGGEPTEETPVVADETEQEDVAIWTGEPSQMPSQPAFPQDTVRLDDITQAVRKREESAQPEETEQPESPSESPEQIPTEPEEPFSQNWEPEYEQPIGEYVPPQPIIFRPKSRLQELKRKLVAGPEKRYYELSETGLGKLQAAIFANLLVALLSGGTTLLYAAGVIGTGRARFVIFVQFLSLLLSALFGSYQLISGFTDMIKKRFSLDSLLLFSLLACLADGIVCLIQVRIPCTAAFSLNMTMSLWAAYERRNTEMGQMDTMRKATQLDSVAAAPDYLEGRPGFLRGIGQVEDFMDTYQQIPTPEKTLSVYALVALLVSAAIGIAAGILYSVSMGLQVFTASILVAVPASSYVSHSRPMALLERRLHRHGSVICGWQGVKGLSVSAAAPLDDHDLFPVGSAKLNGLKFYGQRSPDEVVAYAAALIQAGGGGLSPIFCQLLESRSGRHYDAENLQFYTGGIGAEVNEEAVLAGTLNFMQDMGVEMPEGTRVNQAVYVAIDGVLSGVFAMSYAKTKATAMGLTTLCAYRNLTPVLTGEDFMLTESFLRGKFGVNTRKILFADPQTRQTLREKTPPEDAPALALTTRDSLTSTAYAITGARALRSAFRAGTAVHMAAGILGLVMMLVLGILGAEYLLTPANVLLYELIWTVPGLLITEWTRSV